MMKINGIEKSSFIDYPNQIATGLFTPGCNFRCPYCHNTSIIKGQGEIIPEEELLPFLEKRKRFVEAVCITGGEPTLQVDLYDFIIKLKAMGFLVKLDTNGTAPELLKQLIDEKLIDYVAMDIKAPLKSYHRVTATPVDTDVILQSIQLLKAGQVDYEFRTTLCRELVPPQDILELIEPIKGSKRFFLQNFRDGDTVLAGRNQLTPYSEVELKEAHERVKGFFEICEIRGY